MASGNRNSDGSWRNPPLLHTPPPLNPTMGDPTSTGYPVPAFLKFCPGGIAYPPNGSAAAAVRSAHLYHLSDPNPEIQKEMQRKLAAQAQAADERLRKYALLHHVGDSSSSSKPSHVLPSLSLLAEAVFGRLTGVQPHSVKEWADAMVLAYAHTNPTMSFGPNSSLGPSEQIPMSEEDIWNVKPKALPSIAQPSLAAYLKRTLEASKAQSPGASSAQRRPCGYVFARGDIAWNCRTCQTDATCVICDECFRNSDHEGHEVYFHRTSPGGCCDCGDAEAWKVTGCCDKHRPLDDQVPDSARLEDPLEAVRMATEGLKLQEDVLTQAPTALPPLLTAALATVIGAAVNCVVQAVEGSGIGADPSQFQSLWAYEASLVSLGIGQPEETYYSTSPMLHPSTFWNSTGTQPGAGVTVTPKLPRGYRLHLRLHNDDVHTFEEVIEALREPLSTSASGSTGGGVLARRLSEEDTGESLVTLREQANDMTHHVDADGQVTVKTYETCPPSLQGFRRLKTKGLHCAVVSTAQINLEQRARILSIWLTELSNSHPVAAALVVQALVQVQGTNSSTPAPIAGFPVWLQARSIPGWAAMDTYNNDNEMLSCQRRFEVFPPHLESSFITRREAHVLHTMANQQGYATLFPQVTGADSSLYSHHNDSISIPLSSQYRKSPHALWGTLPAFYSDPVPIFEKHPVLFRLEQMSSQTPDSMMGVTTDINWRTIPNRLTEAIYVVDTDLRKLQEADRITSSVSPHKLPGLHLLSGLAMKDTPSNPTDLRHLLATCSYRAPISSIMVLLLLDPYPTKQLRGSIHALFLSLLTDSRFKCRFAGAFGIAYRPLSTLFCAGVGTEADTPLHFSVQILTAGSLVRALGSGLATEGLLVSDQSPKKTTAGNTIGVFCVPIAHNIVRCIHTNLLGATKEVNMILNNTANDESSNSSANDSLLPALTYVAGEHPLATLLPAAPDDGFLDSRSTRHKRLPHLLRDLEYVMETPGTAIRLLLFQKNPVYPGLSARTEDVLVFPTVFCRMLRLAQGMDPQKRKISGGHVEYEQNRWLEAFGLSLNIASARDALAESPCKEEDFWALREAMGNLSASLLREIKLWLYREGSLETGLPMPSGGPHGAMDLAQVEALQRSTLHVSAASGAVSSDLNRSGSTMVALSCATGVKMTETQLGLIENALKAQGAEFELQRASSGMHSSANTSALVMGDWLRVPHSPLAGDSLSFHLPLHRALAKSVRSLCSVVVTENIRQEHPAIWWKIPILDDTSPGRPTDGSNAFPPHPLVALLKPTLRGVNCRVVWTMGPDCSPQEAHRRRSRARHVSANIAVTKVLHSLADHPIRCLAAAQQIERHLWARNGSSVAGMAMNYTSTPLCRAFRDLDLLLVQLSASGLSVGLGARRVFALLLSRFSMDGYLCDPERRTTGAGAGPVSIGGAGTSGLFSSAGLSSTSVGAAVASGWVNPPRLQDPDHATVLSESFFSTLCVLVTELPLPPPKSPTDNMALQQSIRRELLHALASEARSRSEAMSAAAMGVTRREESNEAAGGLFRETFSSVLTAIGKPKSQTSRSAPPSFELSGECCEEYDPTFFHLRRQEHQHAMDVIARLRKQKYKSDPCLPLVCPPPQAHPRFLPCRLLLHLPSLDAAIRRSLLFALTGGSWLPPPEPAKPSAMNIDSKDLSRESGDGSTTGKVHTSPFQLGGETISPIRRAPSMQSRVAGSALKRSSGADNDAATPFSKEVVAASAVSFLEVLQLLTLQAHTLEECASLHRTLPDLDEESRALSSGLSINSYLSRLIWVPESLVDVWALKPYPEGPLESSGSGEMRGSVLGLLIALYEHRSDNKKEEEKDDGHGGARALVSSGLQWLLRFVQALVDGAPSVGVAARSASSGVPIQQAALGMESGWTIDSNKRATIQGMLKDLPDLWPRAPTSEPGGESGDSNTPAGKSKEAGKAAQRKVMEMMMKKQRNFAASLAKETQDTPVEGNAVEECIICRCDDGDGEVNGPLGYLGHVQRSRVIQMRSVLESGESALNSAYRVVGHMGCQLRETQALDSKALACLPRGSIVRVLQKTFNSEYGILSRRVQVEHIGKDSSGNDVVSKGWASVMSSQGYVILSPLVHMCFSKTKWGSTRPIMKQCGHAAHLKCVETHTLSLHQRAAGDQPYDGRFAANIKDGEFLCPLCKQLSNILIPRDRSISNTRDANKMDVDENDDTKEDSRPERSLRDLFHAPRLVQLQAEDSDVLRYRAFEDFGSHLYQAMEVSWERAPNKRHKQLKWNPAIRKWDFEDEGEGVRVKGLLRSMRQLLISWAAVGHSASAAEAASRSVEKVLPFGTLSETSEPWNSYGAASRDSHPMLLELKRTLSGSTGLLEVFCTKMVKETATSDERTPVITGSLAEILDGQSWVLSVDGTSGDGNAEALSLWTKLTALTSALPSHVARDGQLSLRCEARASAASMWAFKGTTSASNFTPLAVLLASTKKELPQGWGTLDEFMKLKSVDSQIHTDPFRPAVASGFLHTPLLGWDLNTMSGAVFSALLVHEKEDLPNEKEILWVAHMLLCARLVQCIVLPGTLDFDSLEEDMLEDEEDLWVGNEMEVEMMAIARLYAHCQAMRVERCLNATTGLTGTIDGLSPQRVLVGVGRAILPFARSLTLMLRAVTAVIRDRKGAQHSNEAQLLGALENKEIMEFEDGFHFVKALKGPLPSAIIDGSNNWLSLLNRWLVSLSGFEMHHGSSGRTLISRLSKENQDQKGSDVAGTQLKPDDISSTSSPPSAQGGMGAASAQNPGPGRGLVHRELDGILGDIDDDEGEESVEDVEMEDAEDVVDISEQLVGIGGAVRGAQEENGDGLDEHSESGSEDGTDLAVAEFACVSRSPILPNQPSFLGLEGIGPGRYGMPFEVAVANSLMVDQSHLALGHKREVPTFGLIRLPKSFVELYNIVSKVKGREESGVPDEQEEVGNTETAICLLTGTVMKSGSPRRSYNRSARPPGACTMHAREHGSGIGIFFLVQKCTVLLLHNNKSAYSPSLYVDEHGEEDPGLRRGRPLFLSDSRFRALELLWRQQGIPREVAQIRSTSDRVIRDNWY